MGRGPLLLIGVWLIPGLLLACLSYVSVYAQGSACIQQDDALKDDYPQRQNFSFQIGDILNSKKGLDSRIQGSGYRFEASGFRI